jgi:2-haloacid dehalogenase
VEAGVTLDDNGIKSLMDAYNTLHIFPDVSAVFGQFKQNTHIHPVIFSNGTASMINFSLAQSPDLSPHASLFKQVVVVEPVKRYKPDPLVYSHLCEQVGKKGNESDVWLVSGNPFDVVGANAVGMRTCWVDRGRNGWSDRLGDGESARPTVVVKGVNEVVEAVKKYSG